jgi:serralysin
MANQGISASTASGSGQQNIDALIAGVRWTSTTLTYALPSLVSQFNPVVYDVNYDETGTFQPVGSALATAVAAAMVQFAAVSGLSITLTTNLATATFLMGRTAQVTTAQAYAPEAGPSKGGDIWFGLDADFDAPLRGSGAWHAVLHEIGHAMGLKDGHSYIGGTGAYEADVGIISLPVAATRDSLEFTVMTNRSFINQDLELSDTYTNENFGFPQSLMMLDIAALQQLYGADYTTNAGNTTYSFSSSTGEMFVNGVGQGAPGANRVFLTIWDGGGNDTYDFSNYTTNLVVSLEPGSWSALATSQRAELGMGNVARGNVYNALLHQGSAASLIENAKAGTGNDSMVGNQANNLLILDVGSDTGVGGGGDDVIYGWLGNDLLFGGDGGDLLVGEQDNDILVADAGNDTADGGDGDDVIYGWLGNDLMFGGLGADRLFGEQDNDVLVGLEGNDTGFGGDGDDVIYGWLGADELWGGNGNDQVQGEQGNDLLLGEDGQDTVFGGDGDDVAYGWFGVDVLWGGEGNDVLFGEQDTDVLLGEGGNDVLLGGEAQDSLYGWVGNDSLYGWLGDDLLLGEDGDDLLLGEDGNDTLNGGAGNDFMGGQDGDDFMLGFDGADVFFGDAGNDFMGGLSGNDVMVAGLGSDTMWGDGGDDVFVFRQADLGNGMADVVNSFGEVAGNFDQLRFEGVAQANVSIIQQGADVLISFAGNTASIRVTAFNAAALADQIIYA